MNEHSISHDYQTHDNDYHNNLDALVPLIIATSELSTDEPNYNNRIEVFREAGRSSVYQAYALDSFAHDPLIHQALGEFNLLDNTEWVQLLEHMSGVAATAVTINNLIQKYGGAGLNQRDILRASLLHDMEKPAEVAAADGVSGGENSSKNPVIRDGRLWRWMQEQTVTDTVILAAQNTGRSDRYYDALDNYHGDGEAEKKALLDREKLVILSGEHRAHIDSLSATERRQLSIAAKGPLASLIGISDALSAQFKFQGMADENITKMTDYYLARKTDPESQQFFGMDWPAYYKQVREYLIGLVPSDNQLALRSELEGLTHEKIFNQTILPQVLGETTMMRSAAAHKNGQANIYDDLRYPENAS